MGESERPGTKRKSTVFLAVLLARQQLCSLEQGSNSALKRAGERRKRAGKLLAAVIAISQVERSRHLTRTIPRGRGPVRLWFSSLAVLALSLSLFPSLPLSRYLSLPLSRTLCVLLSLCFHSLSIFIFTLSLPSCFPPCFPPSLLSSFPQTLAFDMSLPLSI